MEVTYLGHAAILVRDAGTSLVMDPWLVDPAYCNSWFHYPPLELGIEDIQPLDFVWCSHEHPDHFDPKTLRKLPRDQKFLVPQFTSGRLLKDLRGLGFQNLIPLPFDAPMQLAPDFEVTCIRTDLVWEDSALIVRASGVTLFNMNDCKLGDDLLREIGRRHRPDIAFVPFSGAIHFPTCYGYPREHLAELCKKRRQGHLEQFVHRVELLGARRAVPFAGNFALLHRDQLWMNEPELNNINTPDEAVALLAQRLPDVEPLQMNPGDRWSRRAGLRRHKPAPDFQSKMRDLAALAERVAPELDALRAAETRARPGLRDDLRRYFERIARNHPELCGRIGARIVIEGEGAHGGQWCLDFHEGGFRFEDFAGGDGWNLWMTVPTSMLQHAIDGGVSWDELAISFRMRFKENPEFFNRDFWVMLYNNDEPFLRSYLAEPAPRF
jgi:UDP-MurNAc hydroxylase